MENKYILARKLRKNSSIQECLLWKILRNRQFYGFKFKRQVPIGEYIVDFVCKEKQIIIEIESEEYNTEENILNKRKRIEYLHSKGYKVIQFLNNDVYKNINGVYNKLKEIFEV